jgi:hypothetical protein
VRVPLQELGHVPDELQVAAAPPAACAASALITL